VCREGQQERIDGTMSASSAQKVDYPIDILCGTCPPLEPFFAPRTVAVIGATDRPGSVGRTVLTNLIRTPFGGMVFPINPKHPQVLGIKAYPNVADVPEPVDLAVVITPAPVVPDVIGECVACGVRGAVVISAGFKETGAAGAELEQQVLAQARRGNLRVIGPNCLGIMRPVTGLNATFACDMPQPGSVGFISQSGALCASILDWSLQGHVGFSAFISIGSMIDVGWGDLIDYLGDDPHTQSILIYMESIGDARAFLSAAREVALAKPIIVLKAGRTELAAQAAASHTGALTGSDEVFMAALRRCGVLHVESIDELFNMAEVLGKQPRPRGPRLTIVTNAGGPGVLATDALAMADSQLAELAPETVEALSQVLPAHWSHGNPIDILGDATPDRYAQALAIATRDPGSDGLLVMLTPTAMSNPTETAQRVLPYAHTAAKPILASWMGGARIAEGEALLNAAGVPTYRHPDAAARAFQMMWRYSMQLRDLYEIPILSDDACVLDRTQAGQILQRVRSSGRTLLTEVESKQVLAAYDISTVPTQAATTADAAVAAADAIGYPVVVKLLSKTITHKTDVGGVRLNLVNADAVRGAYHAIQAAVCEHAGAEHFGGVTVQPMISATGYELILGSSIDAQFGPVLLFGSGGQLVEVLRDRALGLPPLNSTLARRMIEQTRICAALQGVRGRQPVDLAALEQVLVRFSQLVVEQHWIKEIEINPLLASAEQIVALDARVVLQAPDVREECLPQLAIRPYPQQYVAPWALLDGATITIRPIRPEDEPLLVHFHAMLSDRSVYARYFAPLPLSRRTAHECLTRICLIDYDRELALVAEQTDQSTGEPVIIGVARLCRGRDRETAEIAVIVADPFQNRGLGTELLRRLIQVASAEQIRRLSGLILAENRAMRNICRKLGFRTQQSVADPSVVTVVLDLV
jgi:acetyltransferase